VGVHTHPMSHASVALLHQPSFTQPAFHGQRKGYIYYTRLSLSLSLSLAYTHTEASGTRGVGSRGAAP
jgi:hypothetical protein